MRWRSGRCAKYGRYWKLKAMKRRLTHNVVAQTTQYRRASAAISGKAAIWAEPATSNVIRMESGHAHPAFGHGHAGDQPRRRCRSPWNGLHGPSGTWGDRATASAWSQMDAAEDLRDTRPSESIVGGSVPPFSRRTTPTGRQGPGRCTLQHQTATALHAAPPRHCPTSCRSLTAAAERLRRFGPNDTWGEGRAGWPLALVKTVAGEPMQPCCWPQRVYPAAGDPAVAPAAGLLRGGLGRAGDPAAAPGRRGPGRVCARWLSWAGARIRGGVTQRIPAGVVVPATSSRCPKRRAHSADGVLREALAVQVDAAAHRANRRLRASRPAWRRSSSFPGGEDTLAARWHRWRCPGHGVVRSRDRPHGDGPHRRLAGIDSGQTPLQRQLAPGAPVRLGGDRPERAAGAGLRAAARQWLQGLLSALAFAMALPEIPCMVMTVFIGLAARRMARVKVLARRPAVVEALGAATVLCGTRPERLH